MSLLFVDSAQHYNTPDLVANYKYDETTSRAAISSAVFRAHHTLSLSTWNSSTNSGYIAKTNLGNNVTIVVGLAFNLAILPASSSQFTLITLGDTGTHTLSTGNGHVCITVDTDGDLQVRKDSPTGTILAETTNQPISIETWYYLEFKVTIDDASGSFELKLDNVSLLSDTNVDTRNAANAYVNGVGLGRNSYPTNNFIYMADIYIDVDFKTPQKSEDIYPNGDGYNVDFTPSAGDNFSNIDDPNAIDEDSTYNSSNTPGQIDSFTFPDVSLTGNIAGIAINLTVRMDDAGPHTIRPFVRIGGVNYPGDTIDVTGTYKNIQYIWEVNPATLNGWSDTDINNAEFGYELVS